MGCKEFLTKRRRRRPSLVVRTAHATSLVSRWEAGLRAAIYGRFQCYSGTGIVLGVLPSEIFFNVVALFEAQRNGTVSKHFLMIHYQFSVHIHRHCHCSSDRLNIPGIPSPFESPRQQHAWLPLFTLAASAHALAALYNL
jgi:hypothetical protein